MPFSKTFCCISKSFTCPLKEQVNNIIISNIGSFVVIFNLGITVGTCCRGGFRRAFLSEGHGTAKRESAVDVPPNLALQYVLC